MSRALASVRPERSRWLSIFSNALSAYALTETFSVMPLVRMLARSRGRDIVVCLHLIMEGIGDSVTQTRHIYVRKAFGSRSSEVDRHGSTIQLRSADQCRSQGPRSPQQKAIAVCWFNVRCMTSILMLKRTVKLQQYLL